MFRSTQFLSIALALLVFSIAPFTNHQMSDRKMVAGGQQTSTPCNADIDNPYTLNCTGTPFCLAMELTHYDWSYFSSEEILVQASYTCSAVFDVEAQQNCQGDAEQDSYVTGCTVNW